MRPKHGTKAVHVSRKDVDSHDAELAARKCDVMAGCDDAMSVESNDEIMHPSKMLVKVR